MGYDVALRRLDRDLGELLARHERGRNLAEFERWADDPVGFASEVLGVELWAAQREMAEAVRDRPQVLVQGGNGVGKDFGGAVLGLWWIFCRRGLVLATAATQRQALEVFHGEVGRLFRSCGDLPGELFASALRVPGAGGLLSFTSTAASRLSGFHGERVLAVLSEAQGVESWAWEGMHSCAVGAGDRLLALGNPLAPSGQFFTAARSGTWHTIRVSVFDHPNIREGRTVIPGGPSPEFVQRIAAEFGPDSPIYTARVEGAFPQQSETGLFSRAWLDAAAERWKRATADGPLDGPAIVGVDPARYGRDESGIAVCRRCDGLLCIERLTTIAGRLNLMDLVGRVVELLTTVGVQPRRETASDERLAQLALEKSLRFGLRWGSLSTSLPASGLVVVDEIGVGAGVLDRLTEMGYRTEGFNAGKSAETWDERERFANLRAASWWRLREMLEEGRIAIPPDEELFEELLAATWRPTPDGRIALPAKDQMRGLLGRSPDRADAVVMAAYVADRERRGAYDLSEWHALRK